MKVNSGTILIGFFAILSGLVGVHLYREASKPKIQPVVQAPAAKAKAAPRKIVVPMVSRDISSGQRITMDDVALVRLSRPEMDKLGIGSVFMTNADQIIGKTVKHQLRRGTTFDTRDFYPSGQGPGISHRLKPGYRAVTIALSPTNALIGFAGAGENVDVLFHYGGSTNRASGSTMGGMQSRVVGNQGRGGNGGYGNPALVGATSTLVQSAEILALNHTTTPTSDPNGLDGTQQVLVTLAVTPESAELLRVARGHGDLSLTLRSPIDSETVPIYNPTTLDKIIKLEEQKVNEMQIYRGKQLSTMRFAGGSGGGVVGRFNGYTDTQPQGQDQFTNDSDFVPADGDDYDALHTANAEDKGYGRSESNVKPSELDQSDVDLSAPKTKFIAMPKTIIRNGVRTEYGPQRTRSNVQGSNSRNKPRN